METGGGNKLKVIQVDVAEGLWIVENIFQAGYAVQTHRHTGPVYGYTMSGAWKYREYDYVNRAGSFLFEPAGSVHTLECFEDDTQVWFQMYGVNLNLDADGNIESVFDGPGTLEVYRAVRGRGLSPTRRAGELNRHPRRAALRPSRPRPLSGRAAYEAPAEAGRMGENKAPAVRVRHRWRTQGERCARKAYPDRRDAPWPPANRGSFGSASNYQRMVEAYGPSPTTGSTAVLDHSPAGVAPPTPVTPAATRTFTADGAFNKAGFLGALALVVGGIAYAADLPLGVIWPLLVVAFGSGLWASFRPARAKVLAPVFAVVRRRAAGPALPLLRQPG